MSEQDQTIPANPSDVPGQDGTGRVPGQGLPGGVSEAAARPGERQADQSVSDAPAPPRGENPEETDSVGVPAPGADS
ncbi:hypothetical protein [Blastococcus sp. Marseille-P5729]|uniref:hypothetical protein n=1 Tax=Blastococcus sp. Marseille-P5729 TaxID=2086582 RepID=UPI000D114159|nr:hypothetical protein [Blastococcus sp. Marseille-P5729]